MRRLGRPLPLALGVVVLLVVLWTAAWFVIASQVRAAVVDWIEERRTEGTEIDAGAWTVTGFPLAFELRTPAVSVKRAAAPNALDAVLPLVEASARPWALRHWVLTVGEGTRITLPEEGSRAAMTVTTKRIDGTVFPTPPGTLAVPGGQSVTLSATDLVIDADQKFRLVRLEADAALPPRAVAGHADAWLRGHLRLTGLGLPVPVRPLGPTIDLVEADIAIKGTIPAGRKSVALAAWRDAGGTLELERASLRWGKLHLAGDGTLALDAAMQPIGSFATTVRGQGDIVDALVAQGMMKPGDALIAKLVLGAVAKPGADGEAEIRQPLRLQNRELYFGPVRLARLAPIKWD